MHVFILTMLNLIFNPDSINTEFIIWLNFKDNVTISLCRAEDENFVISYNILAEGPCFAREKN